jgi:hypothetical protein
MKPGESMRCGSIVPDVDESGVVRIDFEAGFLFRKLPEGWEAERDAARAAASWFGTSGSSGTSKGGDGANDSRRSSLDEEGHSDDEGHHDEESPGDQILVSVQMYMDPKLSYVPTSLLNFVIRTVLYTMWCMLLRVAEQVRDGKSESHQKSIREKSTELYDWVRERTGAMLARLFAGGNAVTA